MPTVTSRLADELKGSLPASVVVVTPQSEKYEESIKRWSATAEKPAGLIVYPTSAEDVSKIVVFGIANSLDIAVVGGGHSTSASSSTDGGLVIDLSKLRACIVDVQKKTVSVQGGALWKDVDGALSVHDLATVGGTVNHTGVGGLTLGGGFGWLSAQYGLTIDNLLAVEFVLADGSIVTASSTENSDLFWAARGAGQAFGVATSFVFQAYEQKNAVWGGMVVFPPTQLKEIFEVSNQLVDACTGKSQHGIAFIAPPPDFHPCLAAVMFYNGSEDEGKKFFEPLYSLKPLADMTSVMPYDKVNEMLNHANPHGFRRSMKGSAFFAPIDPAIPEVLFQDWIKFIQEVPDAAGTVAFFEFFSPRKIIQVPQRETAFANRGAYFNINFSSCWTKEENDAAGRKWVRAAAAKTKEFLKISMAKGTDSVTREGVGEYANYDSIGEKGQVLFGVNFPRLVELKKRYDPENVFGKNLNLL